MGQGQNFVPAAGITNEAYPKPENCRRAYSTALGGNPYEEMYVQESLVICVKGVHGAIEKDSAISDVL